MGMFSLHNLPQIKLGYLLNLSILISRGKEINKDYPSNGEWRGKSSNFKLVLTFVGTEL